MSHIDLSLECDTSAIALGLNNTTSDPNAWYTCGPGFNSNPEDTPATRFKFDPMTFAYTLEQTWTCYDGLSVTPSLLVDMKPPSDAAY
jgi:hypothetical protein